MALAHGRQETVAGTNCKKSRLGPLRSGRLFFDGHTGSSGKRRRLSRFLHERQASGPQSGAIFQRPRYAGFLALAWTIIGVFFGALFLLIAIGNMRIMALWCARRERASLVPLIGGVAGALAFLTLSIAQLSGRWWLPLLLDIGTLPLVALTSVLFLRRAVQGFLTDGRPEDF